MWLSIEHFSLPTLVLPGSNMEDWGGQGVSLPLAYDPGRLSPQGMPRLLRKSIPPNLNCRCGCTGSVVFAAQLLPESPILLAHLYKQLWGANCT